MRKIGLAGAGLLLMSLGACVPRTEAPAPAPPPPPRPEPAPQPPPPASPPPADWRDAPLTPGDWSYREEGGASTATYGTVFALHCEPGRQIGLARLGAAGQGITIRTTYGERTLPASPRGDATVATLPPADPLLDQMVFSRGRFLVQTAGAAPIIVPAWPEPARVIEDCRG